VIKDFFLQALPRKVRQDAIVRFPQLTPKKGFEKSFGRIYGGDTLEAELGQFPFVAHLELYTRNDGEFVCGAAILDNKTIVTAAHCVEGVWAAQVWAGTLDWRFPGIEAQHSESRVFGSHEDFVFDQSEVKNDIAYLKMNDSFTFDTPFVQPISVAAEEPDVGSKVTAIGYGAPGTWPHEPVSFALNYATDLVIVDDLEADIYTNDVDFEHFICTFQGDKGTCGGDNGGPVIDADNNLVGVISFGSANCEMGPSCFTSVPYFREWLNENASVDI